MLVIRFYSIVRTPFDKFYHIFSVLDDFRVISTNGIFEKEVSEKIDDLSVSDMNRMEVSTFFCEPDNYVNYEKTIEIFKYIINKCEEKTIIIRNFNEIYNLMINQTLMKNNVFDKNGNKNKTIAINKNIFKEIIHKIENLLIFLKNSGKKIILFYNLTSKETKDLKKEYKNHLLRKKFKRYFDLIKKIEF
jgi:hypothetical protein